MLAFLITLVVTFLIESGGRPQQLAAILADRYRAAPPLIAALIAATLLNIAISAAGGIYIHSIISARPLQLFQALALLFAAAAMLIPERKLDRLDTWSIGSFATGFLGMAILQFGDSSQFFILATAAREGAPVMAALGGGIGVIAGLAVGFLLGEDGLAQHKLRPFRMGMGAILALFGIWQGLGAMGVL